MLISFFRTIVLYIAVVVAMRIMGKRQIGELQPSEFVVAIMLSELAAIPMQSTGIPLMNGLVPMVTLMSAEVAIAFISMKNKKARQFISGKPSIIVRNGQIDIEEMRRSRYNIDDLMEELRINKCPNIGDVELGIIETNGKLSIILKPDKQSPTLSDLGIKPNANGNASIVISDGTVDHISLNYVGYDEQWLKNKLKEHKINSYKDIFIAMVDNLGNLSFQLNKK